MRGKTEQKILSMYPADIALLKQVAERMAEGNESRTVRMLIRAEAERQDIKPDPEPVEEPA